MIVNSWPTPVGDGSTDVNIEYEIDSSVAAIGDVVIIIPLPVYVPFGKLLIFCRSGSVPEVRELDGDYQVTSAGFEWRPPVGDIENGRLEFNVEGDDAEGFFPVEVRYTTAKTVCTVDVSLLFYSLC